MSKIYGIPLEDIEKCLREADDVELGNITDIEDFWKDNVWIIFTALHELREKCKSNNI